MDFDEFWAKLEPKIDEKIAGKPQEQKPEPAVTADAPLTAESIAEIIQKQAQAASQVAIQQQEESSFAMHMRNKSPDFVSYLSEATDTLGANVSERISALPTLQERLDAVDHFEKQFKQASSKAPITPTQRKARERQESAESTYTELNQKRAAGELTPQQWRDNYFGTVETELSHVADAA